MVLGALIKRAIGPSLGRIVGSVYRSIFVNLSYVAEAIAPHIPKNAEILDIGGGDGEMLNRLLRLRPDVRVVMIDIGPQVGAFLDADLLPRVSLRPSTTLKECLRDGKKFACVMINDVLHHVPKAERDHLLRDAFAAAQPGGKLIIKEFAPGGLRSLLGFLADRYISGDRQVRLIAHDELQAMVQRCLPVQASEETYLFKIDRPNYAFIFNL